MGQSRMNNPMTLATLATQGTGQKTKQKQHGASFKNMFVSPFRP